MTNLDSIFKSRDIILPTKVHLVKAMVFPVVTYGCESWTVKKAKHRRIDAFELWCWRRLLRVPWTARRKEPTPLPTDDPYTLEEFRTDVRNILQVNTNQEAFDNTITISTIWNNHHALVTPLELYFKSLGYYTGEVEQLVGKRPDFGKGMKSATMLYQKNVVKPAKAKDVDGVITKMKATWNKLLLG